MSQNAAIGMLLGGTIFYFAPLFGCVYALNQWEKAEKEAAIAIERVKEVESARADQAERDQRKLWWHMNDLACESRAIKDENAKLRETLGMPSVMVKPKEEQ